MIFNKKLAIKVAVLVIVGVIIVLCCRSSYRFATVDVKRVVAENPAILALRRENNEKIEDLSRWLDTVQKELNAEKKKAKRMELAREYKEIALKRESEIKQNYQTKLKKIESELKELMQKVAKSKGCSAIFDSASVVQGGVNITKDVIEKLGKKE